MKKVFVSGCYDILHGGHIEFFTQAKALGDYLIVCFAGDRSLALHKNKKSSLPEAHKKKLLESLAMVDEVVIGDETEEIGLNFQGHFLRIKPDILAVTEDDKYAAAKISLCEKVGARYVVLPKTLNFQKVSTTEIINYIKAPAAIPLAVTFVGDRMNASDQLGPEAYIISCAISPTVSLNDWPYQISAGLGSSAAYEILSGKNISGGQAGVDWPEAQTILETGLCIFRSGANQGLEFKISPDFLQGRMALLWTDKKDQLRAGDANKIAAASRLAREAVNPLSLDYEKLGAAIKMIYEVQLASGLAPLPPARELAKRYDNGSGGYALYLFKAEKDREEFLKRENTMKIEPYLKRD